MKTSIVAAVLLLAGVCQAGNWNLNYQNFWDLDNALFDSAEGGQVQYQVPLGLDGVGVGLSAGYLQVDVDDQAWTTGRRCRRRTHTLDGDVDDVPLGISLLYSRQVTDALSVGLDTGFRYHLLDSDLTYTSRWRRWTDSAHVDIDNAVTYHVAGNLLWALNQTVSLLVGGGYQWDIDDDAIRVNGHDLGFSNSMEGPFAQAGILIRTQ